MPKLYALFLCGAIMLSQLPQVLSQNLVPNGRLEDVNICTELHAPCSPSAWFCVRKFVPVGYYHEYPDKAASGKQYFELNVVINGPARQYWQTMLLCPLVAGKKYTASVKVSAHDIGPNLNDIGFYFTQSFIYAQKDTLLQPAAYLDFLDAKIIKLKHNWFQLTKEFTAASTAQYLIVGNFSAEDNRAILYKRNSGYVIALMIDDIEITAADKTACGEFQQTNDSLYAIRTRHSYQGPVMAQPVPASVPEQMPEAAAAKPAAGTVDTIQLSNVLFAFDRYQLLNPDTLEAFRKQLSNPAIKNIAVIGYTDDAGTEAYNKNLSEKRAAGIVAQLVARFGIAPGRIRHEGRGISRTYAEKNLNRRVDIYLYY